MSCSVIIHCKLSCVFLCFFFIFFFSFIYVIISIYFQTHFHFFPRKQQILPILTLMPFCFPFFPLILITFERNIRSLPNVRTIFSCLPQFFFLYLFPCAKSFFSLATLFVRLYFFIESLFFLFLVVFLFFFISCIYWCLCVFHGLF